MISECGIIKEFGFLDIIGSDNVKLRLQTHWKTRNNVLNSLDIVLVCNNTVWKGSINGWLLQERARNLTLEYEEYCISLNYALISQWGPKNDIISFENNILRWQKILKVDFLISYGDFDLNLVDEGDLLAQTISSLLDYNHTLRVEHDYVLEKNMELQMGWNNLKLFTEEMIKTKEQQEKKLYAQFVAVLNEKKSKICDLRRGEIEENF